MKDKRTKKALKCKRVSRPFFILQPSAFILSYSLASCREPTFCGIISASFGALAQMGEHLLCKQGVSGSIPLSSIFKTGFAIANPVLRVFGAR